MKIDCLDCGREVEEGDALNGYCPQCVDKFIAREKNPRDQRINRGRVTAPKTSESVVLKARQVVEQLTGRSIQERNMSYCRFENTYSDLADCLSAINDGDLSETERSYREMLIKVCQEIVDTAQPLPERGPGPDAEDIEDEPEGE